MNIQPMDGGFEVVHEGKQVGRIVWSLQNDIMIMNGTFLDDSLRGQNMGQKLLDEAANYARAHQYKMQAVCPYVVKQFDRSDAYDDVKA